MGRRGAARRVVKQLVRLQDLHRRYGGAGDAALQRGQRLVERRERRDRALPGLPARCCGAAGGLEARGRFGIQAQRVRVVACSGNHTISLILSNTF